MFVVEVSSRNIVVQQESPAPLVITAGTVVRQTVYVGAGALASFLEDYVGASTRYIGVSKVAGAAQHLPVWRIRKVDTISGDTLVVGADTFTSVWADRLAATYA